MFLVHFSLAEIFVESDDGGTMEDDIDLRCQDPGREIQLKGPCHEIFHPLFSPNHSTWVMVHRLYKKLTYFSNFPEISDACVFQ